MLFWGRTRLARGSSLEDGGRKRRGKDGQKKTRGESRRVNSQTCERMKSIAKEKKDDLKKTAKKGKRSASCPDKV